MIKIWTFCAALFVRLIVTWCTRRGRYVDYKHAGRTYMRRYVITGFRTGDPEPGRWRAFLPNLYLHHIQAPDSDLALHDHPWPWGIAIILLGGYTEERLRIPPPRALSSSKSIWLAHFKRWGQYDHGDVRTRTFAAPAVNFLTGDTFHRISTIKGAGFGFAGTWTLFFAGPRHRRKGWGYIVEGRGYVPQETRHKELDAREERPSQPPPFPEGPPVAA